MAGITPEREAGEERMKVNPEPGDTWRNKRNGTIITITGLGRIIGKLSDGMYNVEYVTHRGHNGSTWFPYFHGRFEFVTRGDGVPLDVALTKPLEEWPTDFLVRLRDECAALIDARSQTPEKVA